MVATTDDGKMPGYYVMVLCVLGVVVSLVGPSRMYRGPELRDVEVAKPAALV